MIKRKEMKELKSTLSTVVHSEYTTGLSVIFPPWFNLFYWNIYYVEKIFFAFVMVLSKIRVLFMSTGFSTMVFIP